MPAGSGRDRRTRKEAMMRLRTLFAVGGSAIVLGAAVLVAQPAFAATASAAFRKVSAWDTGYTGEYKISVSGGGSITGWTVTFDLPAGTAVGSFWDAIITGSGGHYTAKNREYNGTVAVGRTPRRPACPPDFGSPVSPRAASAWPGTPRPTTSG